ncbi:hypothetical protein [Streptomyces nanshensis]|uniref:Uncharacterized protein n=1 Tax=Streptomyces nanshensis TaxID=518642 RepID=A0A1E7LAR0_9ACTN|nr:hypothetical protein [Streptomyces nanshensis]OEV13289.1 hypothetical protein AN218_04200 [Streptomyces nanshensis]
MNRRETFVFSHKPYAVNLDSLRGTLETGRDWRFYRGRIDAVWFRRKDGITRACIGTLWASKRRETEPTAQEFLQAHDDGRYGGDCVARWDGVNYWGPGQSLEGMHKHLALLRPMLDDFHATDGAPEAPEGYEGWWTFR